MIDMLVLRCWFRDQEELTVKDLPIPLEASIDPGSGDVYAHRHRWEQIPSSHDTLAFKVFDYDLKDGRRFYIEIKASPAKIMQGHNVFGTDDVGKCAYALIECLFNRYPDLFDLLDYSTWSVHQVDVTYHSFADSEENAVRFIHALANVSNGQTKPRSGYESTTYFGKKRSRLKKIKVYAKHTELLQRLRDIERKGDPHKVLQYYGPRLIEYTKGMIRWEVSLYARWLERRGISTNLFEFIKQFDPKAAWTDATKDIFAAMRGREMRVIRDDDVRKKLRQHLKRTTRSGRPSYTLADSVYRTYRTIKAEGFDEARALIPYRTFHRHIQLLMASVGISKAHLMQMKGQGLECEVVPFVRYVKVEFGRQFPDWYEGEAA
ncbi:hypothetical protein MIN45_P1891 [Methylomarinovum tepidoasis]|uniref:Uncharacterized protein n=1 Tax=Methylomarinovum tepidoasis TaxID=2840183 RepID=A0AAU9C0S2_9GAMM|nr:phage/plasmid replication protein, II/X family [Methylomarinovum sp. IN45]BCX89518.1 hypothetical protein MIN45_P1891 [Methylomarinovum sp. IN45]